MASPVLTFFSIPQRPYTFAIKGFIGDKVLNDIKYQLVEWWHLRFKKGLDLSYVVCNILNTKLEKDVNV